MKHLPYQPGRQGGHREEIRSGALSPVLSPLTARLPSWTRTEIAGHMVWQWAVVLAGLALSVVLNVVAFRLGRRWTAWGDRAKGFRRFGPLLSPLTVIAAAVLMPRRAPSSSSPTTATSSTSWPRRSSRWAEDLDDGTASVATKAVPKVEPPPKAPSKAVPAVPTPKAPAHGKASPKPGKPAPPAAPPNPLAPRLRPSGTAPERQALERELKKLKLRLAEIEKRVTEKESRWEALQAEVDEKSRQVALATPAPRR